MRLSRAGVVLTTIVGAAGLSGPVLAASLNQFNQIVVIFQENHSFDNLYGLWGRVGHTAVDGLPMADLAHSVQVRQDGQTPYSCLLQNDVNRH